MTQRALRQISIHRYHALARVTRAVPRLPYTLMAPSRGQISIGSLCNQRADRMEAAVRFITCGTHATYTAVSIVVECDLKNHEDKTNVWFIILERLLCPDNNDTNFIASSGDCLTTFRHFFMTSRNFVFGIGGRLTNPLLKD